MKTIQLILPYPVSNNIYYRSMGHNIILSERGKNYKKIAHLILMQNKIRNGNYTQDVQIKATLYPKLKKSGEPYKKVLDLDNCWKGVLDSLNKICFTDDSQITELSLVKSKYGVKNGAIKLEINYNNNSLEEENQEEIKNIEKYLKKYLT